MQIGIIKIKPRTISESAWPRPRVDDPACDRASCGMAAITTTLRLVKQLAVAGVLVLAVPAPVLGTVWETVSVHN